MHRSALAIALAGGVLAGGCVSFPDAPPMVRPPSIGAHVVTVGDGARLGLAIWTAEEETAIILAVHGMNDYSSAFALPGAVWAARGITTYAYDQRGFGRSPEFGRWAGAETLQADLRSVIAAVSAANPDKPLFVVGHSMGAGIVMAAMADAPLAVEGVVLAAPGIWGGARLPLLYRAAANIAASVAPGKTLSGECADRQSSDNLEILRAMYNDPLVVKETRLDAILGVVRAMGEGWDASNEIGGDILVLYGGKDEIIPLEIMKDAAMRLCGDITAKSYADGWHLLFRDLQGARVSADVADWVLQRVNGPPQARTSRAGPAAAMCADHGR